VTVLDTHDGLGVADVDRDSRHPDDDPLLPRAAIDALIDTIDTRSRGESREASGAAASNVDVSQINCTFYDALGRRDNEYLIARAIQCFVPGIPQLYYVGLLAGTNDMALLRRTRVGRDINRRYYTAADVDDALARPVVRSLLALLRLRNTHPAFAGTFRTLATEPDRLAMTWTHGDHVARLDVDLTAMTVSITGSGTGRRGRDMAQPARGTRMTDEAARGQNLAIIKALTYLMFAMFAMTTGFCRRDHPGGHSHVAVVADRRGNVSVRDDDRDCRRRPAARIPRRSVRASSHDRRGSCAVRRRLFSTVGREHVVVLRHSAGALRPGDRYLQDRRAGVDR
jgi:hypothetical protein